MTMRCDENGGFVLLEVIRDGKNGPEVIHSEEKHNLVVNTGKKSLLRKAANLSTKYFKFMRIGANSAAATSGGTNVVTAITNTLKTVDLVTIDAGRTVKWVMSLPSGGGSKSFAAAKELVILDQHTSPGGSALCRVVFGSVAKSTSDKIRWTYKLRVS